MAGAVAAALPDAQFESWALELGAIDFRRADALVVAGFADGLLALARTAVSPGEIERAFARRGVVAGRAVEHGVTRVFGAWNGEPAQVAIFGSEAAGLELGRLGPLRAAIEFAGGRLRRSRPALREAPLADVAERLGPAPALAFAPGPFEGEWASGLAGLLAAATAVGVSLRPQNVTPRVSHGGMRGSAFVRACVVVAGAWGVAAPAAAERLAACFHVLGNDALGHLMGLDHPATDPVVRSDTGAIALEVDLDAVALAEGLRRATWADVGEIVSP
jgi:hypothetical protein